MTPRIYLDANVFMEAFEREGETSDAARAVLDMIENGECLCVVSALIVAELLVKPLEVSDDKIADIYIELLDSPQDYETCPIDRNVLIEAAGHRARRKATKLPDAIHIATARLWRCAAFVSNYKRAGLPGELIPIGLDATTIDKLRALP